PLPLLPHPHISLCPSTTLFRSRLRLSLRRRVPQVSGGAPRAARAAMIWLRALLFNVGFYLWTATLGILALPVLLGPRRWSMALGELWAAGTMRLLGWIVGLTW